MPIPPQADTVLRRQVLERLRRRPSARPAILFLAFMAVLALLAPLLAQQNPFDLSALDLMDRRLPPGERADAGFTFWLGADAQGRDLLGAILYGLRTSLFVGFCATAGALFAGMGVGLASAQAGGRLDALLAGVVDVMLRLPAVFMALVLLAAIGRGVEQVIVAIVVVQWANYARVMRAAVLVERRKAYVEAAMNQGFGAFRIVRAHVLPNSVAPVLAMVPAGFAEAVMLEAALSFLGAGASATDLSLGSLVAGGVPFLPAGEYWIALFPGLALLALVFAINLAGERSRAVPGGRRQ